MTTNLFAEAPSVCSRDGDLVDILVSPDRRLVLQQRVSPDYVVAEVFSVSGDFTTIGAFRSVALAMSALPALVTLASALSVDGTL